MSIQRILKKYIFLNNEQFGEIAKMSLIYLENQKIDESNFEKENVMFFYINVQKDLDKCLKERARNNRRRKEAKQNENKE